jgi:YfiH family protein
VTEADCRGLDHHNYPECDGLVTNTPGLALVVFTADCTPILLHDPVTGAVGAVHAGWRGTALDIAGKAVRTMMDAFGCKPENIRSAIGPNIGFCCFETDAEVPEAMVKTFGSDVEDYIRPAGEKYYVNLKEINRYALRRAGVTQTEISPDCTVCSHQRFWSHRVTRGLRGSQGAVILCKERKR